MNALWIQPSGCRSVSIRGSDCFRFGEDRAAMGVVVKPEISSELASGMCDRLSQDGDLRLPFSLTGERGSRGVTQVGSGGGDPYLLATAIADALSNTKQNFRHMRFASPIDTQEAKRLHLQELLGRDPSIFLERYGSQLSDAELDGFRCLAGDYEVNFYLQKLLRANTMEGKASKEVDKKNRRLAKMNRMVADGEYFEMSSMKQRAPLLYHHYMGSRKCPDGLPPSASNATTLWESLLDNLDEVDHQEKVKEQLCEQAVARQAQAMRSMSIREPESTGGSLFGRMDDDLRKQSESDESWSESSSMQGMEQDGKEENEGEGDSDSMVSEGEQEAAKEEFLWVMKERFLRGDDSDFVDYGAIDNDATLDEDWQQEQGRDLEEKYFDED